MGLEQTSQSKVTATTCCVPSPVNKPDGTAFLQEFREEGPLTEGDTTGNGGAHSQSQLCFAKLEEGPLPTGERRKWSRRGQLPGEAGMEDDHTGGKKQQFQGDKGQPERI